MSSRSPRLGPENGDQSKMKRFVRNANTIENLKKKLIMNQGKEIMIVQSFV